MTGISRAGSLQAQSYILEQVTKSNASYLNLTEQITTGDKTQRYSGMADQSALTINLANSKGLVDQYQKSADTANSRISAQHNSLSTVIDIATDFRTKLLQAMTSEQADDGRIDVVADGNLDQIEASLNTDLGGVYLFGGTKSDAPPVDLSDSVDNSNGTYYSGAEELMQARIDGNTVLSYGVTADHQGFKDLIASMQRVSSASNSQDELATALDELNSALDSLTQLEADMGHQMKVVETAQSRNEGVQATLTNQLSGLRDVDISAAMVELTQRQTILQASYAVIAKQTDLSLVNYL